MHKSKPLAACFVLMLSILLLSTVPAFAHAILVNSNPAPDAIVSGPNLAISLKFNVRIDSGRSHLQLLLTDGKMKNLPVKAGEANNVMLSDATDLTAGKYKLIWQVLASDGHITRGEIRFFVK